MKRNKQKAGQSSRKKSNVEPTFWMFGIHAIKNALMNEKRRKLRLLVSQNAFNKLKEEIEYARVKYDIFNTKNFKPPIGVESVHQGAFLEVIPLSWASVSEICQTSKRLAQRLIFYASFGLLSVYFFSF
jgi:23S rRNA (guanosine2251-2'-O)-methyltransferase